LVNVRACSNTALKVLRHRRLKHNPPARSRTRPMPNHMRRNQQHQFRRVHLAQLIRCRLLKARQVRQPRQP